MSKRYYIWDRKSTKKILLAETHQSSLTQFLYKAEGKSNFEVGWNNSEFVSDLDGVRGLLNDRFRSPLCWNNRAQPIYCRFGQHQPASLRSNQINSNRYSRCSLRFRTKKSFEITWSRIELFLNAQKILTITYIGFVLFQVTVVANNILVIPKMLWQRTLMLSKQKHFN